MVYLESLLSLTTALLQLPPCTERGGGPGCVPYVSSPQTCLDLGQHFQGLWGGMQREEMLAAS